MAALSTFSAKTVHMNHSASEPRQQSVGFRTVASLALITVLGPSAIDMYLASMPRMAQDLGTSYASLQLTLTVFLLAMGLGQILFGPVVDAFGRRRPLLAGLLLYVLASLGTFVAPSIDAMLWARFVQGLSAALILVVAMSTVRDMTSGVQATRLFALLVTIQGVAPILAPAVGGIINEQWGWRPVMLVLALLGTLALLNSARHFPETLEPAQRIALRPASIMRIYFRILLDRHFGVPALALSAVFFFLFAYIGGAAYVYQVSYGLRSDWFGLLFGATGVAILLGAMASSKMAYHMGVGRIAVLAVGIMLAGVLLALAGTAFGAGLYGIVPGMFVAMLGLGMAEPAIMSMAMASQTRALGSTSALLGAGTHVFGSAATPLAGGLSEAGALSWLWGLLVIALLALALAVWSARGVRGHAVGLSH